MREQRPERDEGVNLQVFAFQAEEKQVVLSSALTCLVPGKTQKLMQLELDRQGAK